MDVLIKVGEWGFRIVLFGTPIFFLVSAAVWLVVTFPFWTAVISGLVVVGYLIQDLLTGGYLTRIAVSGLVQASRED